MKDNLFIDTDSYTTSLSHKRSIWDKLGMFSSFVFWYRLISLLSRCRASALKGTYDRWNWARESMRIFYMTEDFGAKIFIEGMDNITSSSQPVVFVSNHMSMMESMVFPGLLASRRACTFVVKRSLTTHPFFGPTMRARKPIAVDRADPIADFKMVMDQGVENLEKGISVIVFPQSKRMREFDSSQFNTLAIKLAKKAGVSVVPIALKTDFWSNGKWVKDLGKLHPNRSVHIKFGVPIPIKGTGKEAHLQVVDYIESNLKIWDQ